MKNPTNPTTKKTFDLFQDVIDVIGESGQPIPDPPRAKAQRWMPEIQWRDITHKLDDWHMGMSRQDFNVMSENAGCDPRIMMAIFFMADSVEHAAQLHQDPGPDVVMSTWNLITKMHHLGGLEFITGVRWSDRIGLSSQIDFAMANLAQTCLDTCPDLQGHDGIFFVRDGKPNAISNRMFLADTLREFFRILGYINLDPTLPRPLKRTTLIAPDTLLTLALRLTRAVFQVAVSGRDWIVNRKYAAAALHINVLPFFAQSIHHLPRGNGYDMINLYSDLYRRQPGTPLYYDTERNMLAHTLS